MSRTKFKPTVQIGLHLSRQVATVVATGPYFEPSNGTIISYFSTLLTLNGTGFDASDPSQQIITFNLVQGSSSSSSDVTGSVIKVSMTQLVVQFHTLGSSNEGTLYVVFITSLTYYKHHCITHECILLFSNVMKYKTRARTQVRLYQCE